ncbi:MAG: CinA family nicotinamide mononucleotide deamidase-related protein [Bacteroidales bacterium]
MINATICTIGDEILIGQIVDTNSSFISKELNRLGIKVKQMISIADDQDEIISNLKRCINGSDIVVVTGGLGPTRDDITKAALAKLSNCNSFHFDEKQLDIIKDICSKRGIELSELNRYQAFVPDSCKVLPNSLGTAPGMLFTIADTTKNTISLVFSLPGVPFEMIGLMPKVMEQIVANFKTESIYHKTISTFGIPESVLAKQIESWENALPYEVKLAYLPNPLAGVRLRLSIYGGSREHSVQIAKPLIDELKELLGDSIYGEDEDSLESVISDFLRKSSATLSTAESCTGGKIATLITSLPHSSDIYKGSVIAYHNDIKFHLLNVDEDIIRKYGTVSRECVEAMAEGVKRVMNSDYAIATSGIAGPGGGSPGKPVGMLWIAVSGPDFCETKSVVFNGDRLRNIDRFSSEALNFLRLKLGIQHI